MKEYQNEYLQKKIELICSVSADERHLFSADDSDLIDSLRSGLSLSDIAKSRNLRTMIIYVQLVCCTETLENFRLHAVKKRTYFGKHEYILRYIDLLCHISEAEYMELRFTCHQAEMVNYLKDGLTLPEIAHKWDTGVRNVYSQVLTCTSKVLAPPAARKTPVARKPRKGRYQQFAGADLSVLGKRERELLQFRISHPDLSLQQIADLHGITYKTCATILSAAARRLIDGEYVSRKRYLGKESTKAHRKETIHQWREENREAILEQQRKRNKVYYQQNREKILEKARSQRAINASKLAAARKTIDEYRQQTTLSPEQFAEKFDIPLNSVKDWYSGNRDLSARSINRIIKILKEQ